VDAPRVVMDAAAARQEFDWNATTSLHEGLANTWAWFNTIPQ
jgi:nucleoside-diphosphate-sugar epimerase